MKLEGSRRPYARQPTARQSVRLAPRERRSACRRKTRCNSGPLDVAAGSAGVAADAWLAPHERHDACQDGAGRSEPRNVAASGVAW
eukprot:7935214-Alexandrium_andersonii.AAC.1